MTIYLITFDYFDFALGRRVYSIFETFTTVKPDPSQFDAWVETCKHITGDSNANVKIRKRTLKWLQMSDQTVTCSLNPENGYFHLYQTESVNPRQNHVLKTLAKEESE